MGCWEALWLVGIVQLVIHVLCELWTYGATFLLWMLPLVQRRIWIPNPLPFVGERVPWFVNPPLLVPVAITVYEVIVAVSPPFPCISFPCVFPTLTPSFPFLIGPVP